MKVETKGLKAFRRWLATPEGQNPTTTARRLGLSPTAVSAWLNGYARPAHHYRLAIERIAGIPAEDWMTTDERKFVESFERVGSSAA